MVSEDNMVLMEDFFIVFVLCSKKGLKVNVILRDFNYNLLMVCFE